MQLSQPRNRRQKAASQRLEPLESRYLYAINGTPARGMRADASIQATHVEFSSPAAQGAPNSSPAARPTQARAPTLSVHNLRRSMARERNEDDEEEEAEDTRDAIAWAVAVPAENPAPAREIRRAPREGRLTELPVSPTSTASAQHGSVGIAATTPAKAIASTLLMLGASAEAGLEHAIPKLSAILQLNAVAGVAGRVIQGDIVSAGAMPDTMRYFFESVEARNDFGQAIERFIIECVDASKVSIGTPRRSHLVAWLITLGVLMIDVSVALAEIRRRKRRAVRPAMFSRRARLAAEAR